MKEYEFELSTNGINLMRKKLNEIEKILNSKELLDFIGDKCLKEVKEISIEKLSTIKTQDDIDSSTYINAHKVKVKDGYVIIYNDSKIDITSKNMLETTKINYPAQLSLAQIVEYGIGYTGSLNANGDADNWQYDINNHGYKGWYYVDENGKTIWTNGFAGRYVYLTLLEKVKKNASKWINEYIDFKL